ncbi:hypothetical protein M514_01808 [Trichuris suis]|uniref:Uncharacterized protein n=1 Tax=Trichuris suis TaxID=68888 RepID=A0A085NT86_9BILA|nr:hypothetical protein M513_01808 [Trichuris suis]KFD72682.1 hypothetical protein M514_01808 [Trichuris suis]
MAAIERRNLELSNSSSKASETSVFRYSKPSNSDQFEGRPKPGGASWWEYPGGVGCFANGDHEGRTRAKQKRPDNVNYSSGRFRP